MARGRKKVSTDSLDAKIEHQKAVMEKAKLKYEAEKEALAELIKLRNELTYKNYLSGPSDDRDTKEEKCVWEFGTTIQGHDIYIKIKHLEEENILLLSFHEAEKPFVFRYS
jgi:hypothetical protein